jgi:hypothetical protein
MKDFFNVIGIAALASCLFFLVLGIVRAIKKKGRKSIILAFLLVAVSAAAAFLCNDIGNAYQCYDSALYEIKRTTPLDYSLESAMNDFGRAGIIKDSAQSRDLISALLNENNTEAFYEKAERYFSNKDSSITRQDLCRHLYYVLAQHNEIPTFNAWEYYGMFLFDYMKDMPDSEAVKYDPFDCISDAGGIWLSECGKFPDGKAAVYIRYTDEDLLALNNDSRRNGISLRYSHLLEDRLASSPNETEYLIIIDFELIYKGIYPMDGGKNVTAYGQSATVGVYNASDLQLIKNIGTACGEDPPESIVSSGDHQGSYYIAGDIDAEGIEALIKKAAEFAAGL